jgi:hypothetical protein
MWEGNFMERFVPGAFKKTLRESRDKLRVLFQHGQDPEIGDKPIASINDVREDDEGAVYEASLFDGLPTFDHGRAARRPVRRVVPVRRDARRVERRTRSRPTVTLTVCLNVRSRRLGSPSSGPSRSLPMTARPLVSVRSRTSFS